MSKFMVIVPHKATKASCDQAVEVFKSTGSHFLTNAVFGCPDDVHKAWIVIETDTKDEAIRVVPPPFRDKAKAIKVRGFEPETVEERLKSLHK